MVLTLAMDFVVASACLSCSYLLYSTPRPPRLRAFLLHTSVTHARLLPHESRNIFTYPVLTFLIPISALESHALSLVRGFLFSYGGTHLRVLGLRAAHYLYDDDGREWSLRRKLARTLEQFGVVGELGDAWMMTMPSYLGIEVINPLTTWFCYRPGRDTLWLVVLEVHNTFGERHVYILETGKNEDSPERGFDHQWTFPRTFHVSPFNDRQGFYTVSLRAPSHPPSDSPIPPGSGVNPIIRIHLHTPTSPPSAKKGPLKLTALHRTLRAEPLTTRSVLTALLVHPFLLFMSMPRILYQAWVLHYRRRLSVYRRPDPLPVSPSASSSAPFAGGGVCWLPPSLLERAAERRVTAYVHARARALGVTVVLRPGDPRDPPRTLGAADARRTLHVTYRGPQFFVNIVLADDADARASDLDVSDAGLFAEVFGDAKAERPALQRWVLAHRPAGTEPCSHAVVPLEGMGGLLLLAACIAAEWAEWALWVIAGVRWAAPAVVEMDVPATGEVR
ncbi:hypothetical protein BV25DRAFT_423649 [Artomyces pyxidatus]|uniref:Uncharacterized protein n=1 Tax=Artomyces pyxidatus TaxID=48021 RepID=A0ACB8T4F9_9AGAM|nr:hypothetical protein BV25DRAFT_423649 [Artomyces pyxidatus]